MDESERKRRIGEALRGSTVQFRQTDRLVAVLDTMAIAFDGVEPRRNGLMVDDQGGREATLVLLEKSGLLEEWQEATREAGLGRKATTGLLDRMRGNFFETKADRRSRTTRAGTDFVRRGEQRKTNPIGPPSQRRNLTPR